MFEQDLPITSAEQDIFNRKEFAQSLAKALIQSKYESSFVIGLYGSWGSGKTSFVNMCIEHIKTISLNNSHEKLVIFPFNPWLCSDSNQLASQFFIELGNTLQSQNHNFTSAANLLFDYAEVIGNIYSIFEPITKTITKAVSWVKKFYSIYQKEKKTIQNLKKDITSELKKQNIKLVITIDDIDRLSEQEIIAVFQLVKALGDFPNTIYFLSFDYEIVTNALNKIHENKGKEYLEKIIQVSIPMPKAKSIDLERIFNSKLESLLSEQEKNNFHEQDVKFRWYAIYEGGIKSYINSIRDINRFMNTFSLIFQQIGNETDFIDLVGITCLQVFEPNLYNILPQLKGIFFTKTILDEKRKEKIEENIKLVNIFLDDKKITKHKKPAEKILKVLFAGMLFMRSESEEKKRINKNIAYEHAFDRYFSFSLHGAEISKVQIENILYKTDENDQYNLLNSIFISCNFNEIIKDIFSYYHEDNQENFPSSQQTQNLFKNLTLLWETVAKDEQGFFLFLKIGDMTTVFL